MTTCPIERQSVLKLEHVSKSYPLSGPFERRLKSLFDGYCALDDICFEVASGEAMGIIGRNGAGKTTLLSVISGALAPNSGKVTGQGRVLGLFNLGVGFQDQLSGKENIFLNAALFGASRSDVEDRLAAIISFSELGEFIDMPLGSYSQGMRLRLGFSIIVHLDFDILLIDEVLAVGDVVFQNKCFQKLMEFKRLGKTLILSTQDLGLIERFCGRAALLDHGKLLACGPASEVVLRYLQLQAEERFFVGPRQPAAGMVVSVTKKWADDICQWGKRSGTREVVIEQVQLLNRFGLPCRTVRPGGPLTVKFRFNAVEAARDVHFGVAVFRQDGVYCYGTNTLNDGERIRVLQAGRGYCELTFKHLDLSPGKYKISVAVWDKHETLAFDYHNACYDLEVSGMLSALAPVSSVALRSDCAAVEPSKGWLAALSKILDERSHWGRACGSDGNALSAVTASDRQNRQKASFFTQEPCRFSLKVDFPVTAGKQLLWIGFFRDDRVYCLGKCFRPIKRGTFGFSFESLPFLPGAYFISTAVWDEAEGRVRAFSHGLDNFAVSFDRPDHGTVFLEHRWDMRLP